MGEDFRGDLADRLSSFCSLQDTTWMSIPHSSLTCLCFVPWLSIEMSGEPPTCLFTGFWLITRANVVNLYINLQHFLYSTRCYSFNLSFIYFRKLNDIPTVVRGQVCFNSSNRDLALKYHLSIINLINKWAVIAQHKMSLGSTLNLDHWNVHF